MTQPIRHAQSHNVLQRTVGDDVLLALSGRPEMERLSGTSAAVWRLLAEPRTLDEIVEALAAAYNEVPDTVRAGVAALLDALRDKDLVQPVPDADA